VLTSLRAVAKQSILSLCGENRLLRGTCHRARIRATRWLAMTISKSFASWLFEILNRGSAAVRRSLTIALPLFPSPLVGIRGERSSLSRPREGGGRIGTARVDPSPHPSLPQGER